MNKNKKSIFLFPIILFVAYFLMPRVVLALEVDYPAIRFPGGVFDLNSAFEVGKLTIESLVIFVYAIFLILAGIIMFISLTRAGFMFIYSGSNPAKRTEAKKRFFSVLIGLVILIFSFTFLNIINPDITRLDEPLFSSDSSATGTFNCSWNELVGGCEVGIINCELGYELTASTCDTNILSECDSSIDNQCISTFSFGGISAPSAEDSGTFSCSWNNGSCVLVEPTNCMVGFTAIGNCETIPEKDICDVGSYTCDKE